MPKKTINKLYFVLGIVILSILIFALVGMKIYVNSFIPRSGTYMNYAGDITSADVEYGLLGSKTAIVNDYIITTELNDYVSNNEGEGWGCWGKYKIVKGNETIFQTTEWSKKTVTFRNDEIIVQFRYTYAFRYSDCKWIANTIILKVPEDSFVIDFVTNDTQIIKGQNITFDVVIDNNYGDVKGNLILELNVPTDIGNATTTESRYVNLTEGNNIITFTKQLSKSADELIIKAKLDILATPDTMSGVNLECYGTKGKLKPYTSCTYIQIGSSEEFKYTVNVIDDPAIVEPPKPINIKKIVIIVAIVFVSLILISIGLSYKMRR